jgi:hypothetical protein
MSTRVCRGATRVAHQRIHFGNTADHRAVDGDCAQLCRHNPHWLKWPILPPFLILGFVSGVGPLSVAPAPVHPSCSETRGVPRRKFQGEKVKRKSCADDCHLVQSYPSVDLLR